MLCLCRRIQRRWDNNEIVGEYRLETLSLWKSESNHEITDWYFCMRDNWHGFLYKVCPEPSSVDTLSVNQTSDSSTKIQHDAVKGRKKESQKKKGSLHLHDSLCDSFASPFFLVPWIQHET